MNSLKNTLSAEEATLLAELEPIIQEGMANFARMGNALKVISDRRLYRETHATFKEYVEAKWNMAVSRAYQLCEAAETIKSLPEMSTNGRQINERQARELAKAAPEDRADIIEKASNGKKLTAKGIKDAVNARAAKECAEFAPEPEDDEPDLPAVGAFDPAALTKRAEQAFHKAIDVFEPNDLPIVRNVWREILAKSADYDEAPFN
jgi:hypothetical protein